MSWNVFIIGQDELSRQMLPHLRHREDYAFHELLSFEEVVHADEYPFERLVATALAQLERFPGSVDAIVGYWDFPTSGLLPVLRREYGLPGPSLEAFLKWSFEQGIAKRHMKPEELFPVGINPSVKT